MARRWVLLVVCCCVGLSWAGTAAAGTITTLAGSGDKTDNGPEQPALKANINQPFGLEFGPDGGLYVCERGLHRIRRWDPRSGVLSTVAGTGQAGYTGDGGPATSATLREPHELRFGPDGRLYFTDMANHVIRRVDLKSGRIDTVAGTGQPGFSGDGGPATGALLKQPHSLAFDPAGRLYIADIGNHRIRRVDLDGTIQTIGGTGEKRLPRDGSLAASEPILGPRALWVDGETLWIALREGNAVWRMDLQAGTLHHVAGTGVKGYAVDGGPCREAQFAGPKGIAVGPGGLVYLVDSDNHCIRRIDPRAGTVENVAGIGPKERGFSGDGGEARAARLNNPHGVCITPDGTVYIGDSDNHRVRVVRP